MCLAAVEGGVTPGLVVLVAAQGQTVFHQAFGARQLVPRQLPALPETMYDVASLTKAVATSVLAMQESRRRATAAGRRSWPVSFPSFPAEPAKSPLATTSPFGSCSAIRPGCRRTARSGSRRPTRRPSGWRSPGSPRESRSTYPPGTRAVYSDLGFILLGWLLERLTGARLDVLFQDRIAGPLGLAATTFVNLADTEARARLLGDRTVAATQLSRRAPWPRARRGGRPERLRHGRDRRPCRPLQHRRRPRCHRHGAPRLLPRRRRLWSGATWSVSSGRRRGSRDRPGGSAGTAPRIRDPRPARSCRGPASDTWRSPAARSGSNPAEEVVLVLLSNRVHPAVPTDDRFRRFRPALHDAALSALGYDGR